RPVHGARRDAVPGPALGARHARGPALGHAAADAARLDLAGDREAPGPAWHLRLLPEGGAGERVLLLRELAGGPIRDDLDPRQRAGPADHLAELPADVPAAARERGGRARGDDAMAPAAYGLPSAGAVRTAAADPGLQPARDAGHGARGEGHR